MLSYNSSHKVFEILVEFSSKRSSVAQLGKFAIDSSYYFDIVMLNELQIFLFILFGVEIEFGIEL